MKNIIIFLVLFFSICNLYSQSIVWEEEREHSDRVYGSLYNTLIDSKGDLVILIDDFFLPFWTSTFLKYDKNGNLLSNKLINPPDSMFTNLLNGIIETNNGYKVLGSRGILPTSKFGNCFYANTDLDYSGTVIKSNSDTANYKAQYFDTLDFWYAKDYIYPYTFNINSKYYALFVKGSVKTGDHSTMGNQHIIALWYDTTGKMFWRRGYDSIKTVAKNTSYGGNIYTTKTYDNNLLISFLHIFQSGDTG